MNFGLVGVVQPSRIGADGRPEPVEHVLQLVEGASSSHTTDQENSQSAARTGENSESSIESTHGNGQPESTHNDD